MQLQTGLFFLREKVGGADQDNGVAIELAAEYKVRSFSLCSCLQRIREWLWLCCRFQLAVATMQLCCNFNCTLLLYLVLIFVLPVSKGTSFVSSPKKKMCVKFLSLPLILVCIAVEIIKKKLSLSAFRNCANVELDLFFCEREISA